MLGVSMLVKLKERSCNPLCVTLLHSATLIRSTHIQNIFHMSACGSHAFESHASPCMHVRNTISASVCAHTTMHDAWFEDSTHLKWSLANFASSIKFKFRFCLLFNRFINPWSRAWRRHKGAAGPRFHTHVYTHGSRHWPHSGLPRPPIK